MGLIIGFLLATAIGATASSNIRLVVNGREFETDVPPQLINGRVMVPARFIAEPLGAEIKWDEEKQAVIINSVKNQPATSSEQISIRTNNSIVNQNGIWYANARWLIETLTTKYPDKVIGFTALGDLQMVDKTIHLLSAEINGQKYWNISPLLERGLLSESDLLTK